MTASPASAEDRPALGKTQTAATARMSTISSHSPTHQRQESTRLKKWEVFPGRNKFWCDGRLMMARQTGVLYFTVSIIIITVALFFSFDCRLTLVSEINYGFIIPIVCGLLLLFNLSCLLRTAWSDPGIIPRATAEEASYIEKYLQAQDGRENTSGYRPPPRSMDITVNGAPMKLKYCFTCKIFRPPRSSHCSLCDNCVENFDHHCPWVGNCVGRRNYRYFYLFNFSLTLLCVFIFAFAITNMVLLSQKPGGFVDALKTSPGSVLEIVVCFFSVWSIVGLTGFHSYLILRSVTTNEDIKGTWSVKRKEVKNPFDHGNCFSNCCYVLCSPLPPSMIDRRGYASEESVEAFNARREQGSRLNGAVYGATPGQSWGGNPYPVQMDTETYDTNQAAYPRQPDYPSRGSVPNTSTNLNPRSLSQQEAYHHVDEPMVTITHHAITTEAVKTPPMINYNANPHHNTVAFHQAQHRHAGDASAEDDDSQPGVIIEHLGPVLAGSGDSPQLDGRCSDDSPNTTVLSTDSRTLLLDDNTKQNGIIPEKSDMKLPKMSSV